MEIDHIGVVVKEIEEAGRNYSQYFQMKPLSPIFLDPIQKVKIQFWGKENELKLELIQPLGSNSPVYQYLQKGGGLSHLCFRVDNIDAEINRCHSEGAILISGPDSAVAFENHRVAFLFIRNIGLVEFVEKYN